MASGLWSVTSKKTVDVNKDGVVKILDLNEVVHGEGIKQYTAYRQDGLAILRATPIAKKEGMPVEAKPRWVPDK